MPLNSMTDTALLPEWSQRTPECTPTANQKESNRLHLPMPLTASHSISATEGKALRLSYPDYYDSLLTNIRAFYLSTLQLLLYTPLLELNSQRIKFRKSILHARHYSKCSTYITYLILTTPWGKCYFSFPFYRWRNWIIERLNNLLGNDRARIENLHVYSQIKCNNDHIILLLSLKTFRSFSLPNPPQILIPQLLCP